MALKAQRSLKEYKQESWNSASENMIAKPKSKMPSFSKLSLAKLSQELNEMSLAEMQRLPLR